MSGGGSYDLEVDKETTSEGIMASCSFGVVRCGVSLPRLLSEKSILVFFNYDRIKGYVPNQLGYCTWF